MTIDKKMLEILAAEAADGEISTQLDIVCQNCTVNLILNFETGTVACPKCGKTFTVTSSYDESSD